MNADASRATEPARTPTLDDVDRAVINRLQRGLPIVPRPYRAVADELRIGEQDLLDRLDRLLADGVLTRFGPMFQIERAGGRFTLAAMAVPEDRFEEVNAIVNAFPEVAHNYARTHTLNMWFVVATQTASQCEDTLRRIEAATGLKVHDMPKEREFRVNLYLEA